MTISIVIRIKRFDIMFNFEHIFVDYQKNYKILVVCGVSRISSHD